MKKFTTFPNILQKVISQDEFQNILDDVSYEEKARKFDVMALIQMLTSAAVFEWKSFRHCMDSAPAFGLEPVHYSTISKKASEVNYAIMKKIFDAIVSKCNHRVRRDLKFPKELMIVDSTTMTVGKSRLPWAKYHGDRSGVKLHVSYFPEREMPGKVVETIGLKHDGPIGEQLFDERYVLIEDRAYFKIERIDEHCEAQGFVIRMKDNIVIHRPKSLKRLPQENSPVISDITCQLGTPQSRSEKRHRVVTFLDNQGREIRVVTSLHHISAEMIAEMYKARWEIEVFFRWIKQHLNVPRLFGTTENAVFNQLFAALIAYVLLKWLYESTSKRKVFKRLSFVMFKRLYTTSTLPIDWLSEMLDFLKSYSEIRGSSLSNFG